MQTSLDNRITIAWIFSVCLRFPIPSMTLEGFPLTSTDVISPPRSHLGFFGSPSFQFLTYKTTFNVRVSFVVDPTNKFYLTIKVRRRRHLDDG